MMRRGHQAHGNTDHGCPGTLVARVAPCAAVRARRHPPRLPPPLSCSLVLAARRQAHQPEQQQAAGVRDVVLKPVALQQICRQDGRSGRWGAGAACVVAGKQQPQAAHGQHGRAACYERNPARALARVQEHPRAAMPIHAPSCTEESRRFQAQHSMPRRRAPHDAPMHDGRTPSPAPTHPPAPKGPDSLTHSTAQMTPLKNRTSPGSRGLGMRLAGSDLSHSPCRWAGRRRRQGDGRLHGRDATNVSIHVITQSAQRKQCCDDPVGSRLM